MRVLLIGAFTTLEGGLTGGQVVKNNLMFKYLSKCRNIKVVKINSTEFKKNFIKTFIKLIAKATHVTHIVVCMDKNGMRILFPFIVLYGGLLKKKVIYVVIGGWLVRELRFNLLLRKVLSKINQIHVETRHMKLDMENLGYQNIYLLPNFREFKKITEAKKCSFPPLKLVFLSRVSPMKGVNIAIEAVKYFKNTKIVTLDIYGPIEKGYEKKFWKILHHNEEVIKYKGVIPPQAVQETLINYDFLLFPTFFEGEGLPGIIIESFSAGTPVIASDHGYNTEFVVDKYTGFIFKSKNVGDLINKIKFILASPCVVEMLSKNCLMEAEKYHIDNVLKDFVNKIKNA